MPKEVLASDAVLTGVRYGSLVPLASSRSGVGTAEDARVDSGVVAIVAGVHGGGARISGTLVHELTDA